ncbi:uncharacterized protein LOC120076391 isoform X2 [Benincasa hispida]|uniref:uncharacterized protein LOC120076391 isoform X2 n=1 Tax=Benincasa hispida TaxID=102211 RepID=UPI0019019B4F|nr:uncharacterized protein LOC120076391 isoform X2 [Benincasa hispida]
MSNFSGSHCNNSGCESGWTMYFEESIETEGGFRRSEVDYGGGGKEEEEGDLSMISDASSGPMNGYYEENNYQPVRRNGGKSAAGKSKRKEEMGRRNQHSCLDDTASSPVFGLSNVREMSPYRNEGLVENVKEFSQQTHSRKQHGKKQTSFFQSSSVKKLGKNVSGDYQEQ